MPQAWKNVSKGALDFILRLLQVRALEAFERATVLWSLFCQGETWRSPHGRPGRAPCRSPGHCSCSGLLGALGCLEGTEPPVASKWFQCADDSVQSGLSRYL